jgi:DNA-binding PadR family transcriptional regulator
VEISMATNDNTLNDGDPDDVERFQEQTATARDLLYLAYERDDPTGQDLRAALSEVRCGTTADGQLYPNLNKLINAGLLEKHDLGSADSRENAYRVTELGEKAVCGHLAWLKNEDVSSDSGPESPP